VAGRHAGLAPGAGVEVDLEGILLPGAWPVRREEIPIDAAPVGAAGREAIDGRQTLLLAQQCVEQGQPQGRDGHVD
jgi:hypothetical protein